MSVVRVLVFGAIGHIGANLRPRLLLEGCAGCASVRIPASHRRHLDMAARVAPGDAATEMLVGARSFLGGSGSGRVARTWPNNSAPSELRKMQRRLPKPISRRRLPTSSWHKLVHRTPGIAPKSLIHLKSPRRMEFRTSGMKFETH